MSKQQQKEHVLRQVREMMAEGFSQRQACKIIGVARSTVQNWLSQCSSNFDNSYIEGETSTEQYSELLEQAYNDPNALSDIMDEAYNPPNIFIRDPLHRKQEENFENILDFIATLAPIQYPAPVKPAVLQSANPYCMVIGDTHFGMEDWNVLNLFLEAVSIIKPATVVLNGDTLDLFAISRYPKDVRHIYHLKDEREAYHKFLKMLHDVTADFDCKIYETNANHSGDGVEGRWWRYLSERIGEIAGIPGIQESLSYENVFLPKDAWSRIQLVEHLELCNGDLDNQFVIMHGDVVRRHGGFSARGILEKWYTSAMVNHTHRIGMTPQTFPAIGSKKTRVVRVYENGCACSLTPCYASAANWQNAFSIINYSEFNYSVETAVVVNDAVAISTLGKTLKV